MNDTNNQSTEEDVINHLLLARRLTPFHLRVNDSLNDPRWEEVASLPECSEDVLGDTSALPHVESNATIKSVE